MSVKDLRKHNNRYYEIEKMPGPDVQQLPGGGARRHILFVPVHCILLGFSNLTLLPFHLTGVLFLGPFILSYFLLGSTPLAPHGDEKLWETGPRS